MKHQQRIKRYPVEDELMKKKKTKWRNTVNQGASQSPSTSNRNGNTQEQRMRSQTEKDNNSHF